MTFRKIALATAALGLAAAPVAAESARDFAPISQESEAGGENSTLFYLLGAAAIIAGIIVVASDDDDATSP